ncbi:hypothetical protein CC80DRAFT_78135 [Byssothecium circinans]|uniref:Myb-like DNA-binding domain-containing protein n=1 Tax=Byssothecium circinans TaxID=147558 RepID=A0A6A5TSU0_9PLEO|nr:hypothetical protein CC80DRAFT_78135 [Byssothecium circinans]
MPTEEENLQFLYLVLTHGGQPNLNMTAIANDLGLSNGATSKRWSRLKQAVEAGKPPGPSAYEFLWLALKHNPRDKAPDWKDIAEQCNTTSGAASKRYSRMKQAFEKGTPATPTSTPKRKRGETSSAKKKTPKAEEEKDVLDADGDDECEDTPSKKPKTSNTKPKAMPKPKGKGKKETAVKQEATPEPSTSPLPQFHAIHNLKPEPGATAAYGAGETEQFYDAAEYASEAMSEGEEAVVEESEFHTCHGCECQVRALAEGLANATGTGVNEWLNASDIGGDEDEFM